jgi:hypothetical protein
MSKPVREFYFIFVTLVLCSAPLRMLNGQTIRDEVEVEIGKGSPVATVKGRSSKGGRNISFLGSIGGIDRLRTRITDLRLMNSDIAVPYKELIDGEFLAESDFSRWKYEIDLTPQKDRSAAAHVSWLSDDDIGILMAADFLPRYPNGKFFDLRFTTRSGAGTSADLPIYTSEKIIRDRIFAVESADDAVFYVGNGWRGGAVWRSRESPSFLVSGKWNFTDTEASDMFSSVFLEYKKIFGYEPEPNVIVALARFPGKTAPGEWQAETRGRNVTIISSDMPFRTQSLQRLHEQLRHEVFHLWIPNGVNLTGNYDWFYEGFALYESLKLAIGLNRIRFEDFLDTLSRAHTIDSSQSQRTSLIQASKDRFSGANTQVYARGMLVAFLCDLALLEQSKGKKSVENVLTELFAKHRKPAEPVDANTAVLALLRSNPKVSSVVDKYVTGSEKIDWTNDLAAFGIEDADAGPLTTLRVREKLNGRQKTLLDKLGYNNWRKLSPTSK